jgi:hypothetical protein
MVISRLCYILQICTLLIPVLWTRSVQATPNSSSDEPIAALIIIGHNPTHHYVIAIPPDDSDNNKIQLQLARIRTKIAPIGQLSFITQNCLGSYIYAASFTDRHQAEGVRQRLLKDESRARVIYFP